VPLPSDHHATIDDIVADGVLISAAAIRLAVKNRIVLEALRDGVDYSADRVRAEVREELLELAREKDADADWAARASREAALRGGTAEHHSDFRAVDSAILDRRGWVSRGLADRLRGLSEDDGFVEETAERARDDAWTEIAASITTRAALSSRKPPDAAYGRERGDRLLGLLDDIAALGAKCGTPETS